MKYKVWSLLFVLLFVLSVAPVMAQEPVILRMSTWAGVDESAELQVILDEINASQSEYQIVHEPLPSDYDTQVKTQLAGNTGADLYWINQDNMALKSEGVFMDLTDCLANAEPGTAGDVNDYYPGILAVNEYEGGIYGLPWIAQPVVTFYNRALFEAAGVEEPTPDWTWDDFMEKAQALTLDTDGDGNIDQWGFTNNSWPPPYIFIWQAGGDILNQDFTEAPIDSPESLSGLEFWLSTAYNPAVSPSRDIISEQGFEDMFRAGKVAMFMGGAADPYDREEGLDVGVVRVPGNPDTGSHTTFAWNASTVINAQTQHPEEACKALLAVTEGIQNWKIVSPRISQGTVEHLVATEPRKEASAEAIIEASQDMRALPIFGNFAEFGGILWNDFLNPLLNNETDLTPEELAAEIRLDLEDTLP